MSGGAVCLCAMLGCSGDGGFFPGQVNHNEGAIDYRVAPIEVAGSSTSRPPSGESNFHHLVALGGEFNQPYVRLGAAKPLRSFIRARKPDYVLFAEQDAALRESERESAQQAFQVQEARIKSIESRCEQARLDADDRGKAWDRLIEKAEKALEGMDRRAETVEEVVAALRSAASARANSAGAGTPGEAPPVPAFTAGQMLEMADSLPGALGEMERARGASKRLDSELGTLREAMDPSDGSGGIRLRRDSAVERAKVAAEEAKKAVDKYGEAIRQGTVDGGGEYVQSVRVTLKQAYLREFREPGPVGEVAVLVTVKESRNGLGQQEPRAGRVVYYSEGARKNAFLNFRDQPVYGPIRYSGEDLHIRVSIVELDESDNRTAGAVLKTVATLGSIAYPPSSPVLGALDQIGASLITLNGPDLEWDYLMRLSARPAVSVQTSAGETSGDHLDAWIRDGYYVMLRSDVSANATARERVPASLWSQLHLDPQSGVLYLRTMRPSPSLACGGQTAGCCGSVPAPEKAPDVSFEPYTQHSYLVFAVQSGFDSSQLDLSQQATELGTAVEAYSAGSASLGAVTDSLAGALKDAIQGVKAMKEQSAKMPHPK